jgi:aryl-alcohol dehydrogenase-like predicted oxidoreductase
MQRRPLGSTGLEVGIIALGTMTWGQQNSADEAFLQLDMALDHGVNLIDTAEMYPVPPRAETYGQTESILGQWLQRRPGARDRIVLASKVAARSNLDWIRSGPRLTPAQIHAACEASLRRLGVDHLDLYQVHWPDRRTNFFGRLGYSHGPDDDAVAIEDTLGALQDLVSAGKIRHYGISNETPWGLHEYLRLADGHAWPHPASIQNPYSLLNRSFEVGLAEMALREDVGLLAYSPLAFGVLSGKYLDGAKPDAARLTVFGGHFSRYTNTRAVEATARYVRLAREAGLDPAQMALAWVNSRPFLTANIIGATSLEQLRDNLAAADLTLSDDVVAAIEDIHADIPNPAP